MLISLVKCIQFSDIKEAAQHGIGWKGKGGQGIIRYVLLVLPECYEIVIWVEIVTGEPSRKSSNRIHKHSVRRIHSFSNVCIKDIK